MQTKDKIQTADWGKKCRLRIKYRLQTGEKMQTKDKIQTADWG